MNQKYEGIHILKHSLDTNFTTPQVYQMYCNYCGVALYQNAHGSIVCIYSQYECIAGFLWNEDILISLG